MASWSSFALWLFLIGCFLPIGLQGGTLTCRQEGRFPHPEDCGAYIDCLRTHDGRLLAREGSCHGFPFCGERRRCVSHEEKPTCSLKGTRISFPISAFDHLCAKNQSRVGCVNCNLAFSCINGSALVDICDTKSLCEETLTFGGSVCNLIPSNASLCKCNKTGLITDPYNASYISYCDISTNPYTLETFMCSNGSVFNDVTQKCEVSLNVPPETPACNGKIGAFVNPNDCRWYYTCIPGGVVRTNACSKGEYFLESSGQCRNSCNITSPSSQGFNCTAAGHFSHPSGDCTKYKVCKVTNGTAIEETCYPGFYFNIDTRRCTDTTPGQNCTQGFNYYSCPGQSNLKC